MSETTETEHQKARKKVWGVYSLITVFIIILLLLFVAQDNEERLFSVLMTAAAAYVFRPTDRTIDKYAKKLFGVEPPAKESAEAGADKDTDKPS